MVSKRKNKDYYAVIEGRINEPTIFSSWGDAHPRVTGCRSVHKSFDTIEEAREYMKKMGATRPQEIIKDGAGDTTPTWNSEAFYAVANGTRPGVYLYWHGEDGSEPKIDKIPGACHKRFRTKDQAQAFIEDWRQSVADVYRAAIKEALNKGFRPRDLKLNVEGFLYKTEIGGGSANILDEVKLDELNLKEE
ncbi:hypothetical protein N658DRAFT_494048 [Parathielavia hyrcaniae]|uniref:Ribonuclease H1 N-terminal domain-containing protein n=1 Tax=Parathielavia hyrcaniae TaxID=113614 RepID=A0AAN6T451_9PEZI|nr:hypothetical protein N658DRAFT_494048 [Parathielavia hyrcaniae]